MGWGMSLLCTFIEHTVICPATGQLHSWTGDLSAPTCLLFIYLNFAPPPSSFSLFATTIVRLVVSGNNFMFFDDENLAGLPLSIRMLFQVQGNPINPTLTPALQSIHCPSTAGADGLAGHPLRIRACEPRHNQSNLWHRCQTIL